MQNVLVTGASSGIGFAIATYLASHGFKIYAGARKDTDIKKLDAIENITGLKLDVLDDKDIANAVALIEKEDGELYSLVNNAGIAVVGPLMDLDPSDLQRNLDVNIIGLHNMTRAAFPLILNSKGRIVMMSSNSGWFGAPFFGPYCTSKYALEGYSECLRRELLLYDVKVIKIRPGKIKTPIWDKGKQYMEKFKGSMFEKEALLIGNDAIKNGKTIGMDPIEIGKLTYKILTVKNPMVIYNIAPDNFAQFIKRSASPAFIDRKIKKALEKHL